jgi:hypothetical protein
MRISKDDSIDRREGNTVKELIGRTMLVALVGFAACGGSPTSPDLPRSALVFDLTPNPVSAGAQFVFVIRETNGVGVSYQGGRTKIYSPTGTASVIEYSADPTTVQQCWVHIPPFGQCQNRPATVPSLPGGEAEYQFDGRDDNGHVVTFTSQRLKIVQ